MAQQRTGFRPSPPFERPPARRHGRHFPHSGGRRDRRPVDGGRPDLHVPCRHSRAREVRPHLERFPGNARGDEGARERSEPEGDRSRWDGVPRESFRAVRTGRVPRRRQLRQHERGGGRDPEDGHGRRLDRSGDRVERPGRSTALRPRRDGQSRRVVWPRDPRSCRVRGGGHGSARRPGLFRDLRPRACRIGDRARGGGRHLERGRWGRNLAGFNSDRLRDPGHGRIPPGSRGGYDHRHVPGRVARPHGHCNGTDTREWADDPRRGGRGHERDERHDRLGDNRTRDDGGAVWAERCIPDPQREHVGPGDEPRDNAHEPRSGYRICVRGHVSRPTRERDDGYERRRPVPPPDGSARRRPPRDRRQLLPSGARSVLSVRPPKQRVDGIGVARRGSRNPEHHDPPGPPRRNLAGRLGTVSSLQRDGEGPRETLPRRRRPVDRLLPRRGVGPVRSEFHIPDAGERGLGSRGPEGDVRVRPPVDRTRRGNLGGSDQRDLHGRRGVHAPPKRGRGR